MSRLSGSFNFSNATRVQESGEEMVANTAREAENEKTKVSEQCFSSRRVPSSPFFV